MCIQNTPLLLAAKEGHRKVVKLLLDDVVDVSATNEEGHNCLVTAILNGHRSDMITRAQNLLISHNCHSIQFYSSHHTQ